MDSASEATPGGGQLIQRAVEAVPEQWLTDQAGTAHAERMAQLTADQDLIRRAQLERFAGPAWAKLSTGLAQYGYPVMSAWIWTGKVFRYCRDKNISVWRAPEGGIGPATAEELATDTVGIGLTMFEKRVLRAGLWDPTRGASVGKTAAKKR